jgi:formamidopyrimidine-DNA glycosylase
MPELPEVETIVRELRRQVTGKTIVRVRVAWERSIQGQAKEFRRRLAGKTIAAVSRRGKFIGFELGDGTFFTVHLRMTGRFVRTPEAGERKHVRVAFRFGDGGTLCFVDPRKFGRLRLWPCKGESCPGLGPEPLKESVVRDVLAGLRTRRPIKAVLLDQSVLAGIGNIYADEALHAARIHPMTPAARLRSGQRRELSRVVPEVLREAVRRQGTTLRDYRTASGSRGRNAERLRVYGRDGLPCLSCGAPVERRRIAGRSSHFCPRCQKKIQG